MVWHQWTLASGVNQFVFFLGLSQGHLLSEKGRQYHNNITRHQREEVKITKDGILIDKDDIARRPQFLKDSHFTFRYTHGFIHNYLWMKHLVCEPCTGQTLTDTAPCVRVTTARVLFILILHHSSQRDKSLTVTPEASHWSQCNCYAFLLVSNHIPGLSFAELLHGWSVSPDGKLSHHLKSSSSSRPSICCMRYWSTFHFNFQHSSYSCSLSFDENINKIRKWGDYLAW